jgi:hypothetical protein
VNQNGSPVLFYLCRSLLLKNSKLLLMSQQPFKKFINPKNNAAIKEKHRQEKKLPKNKKLRPLKIVSKRGGPYVTGVLQRIILPKLNQKKRGENKNIHKQKGLIYQIL